MGHQTRSRSWVEATGPETRPPDLRVSKHGKVTAWIDSFWEKIVIQAGLFNYDRSRFGDAWAWQKQ
jgi:hypothetical protein